VNSGYIHNIAESFGGSEDEHKALSYKVILVVVFVLCFLFTLGIVGVTSLTRIATTTDAFSKEKIPALGSLYILEETITRERFLLTKIQALSPKDMSEYAYLAQRFLEQQNKTNTELTNLAPHIIDEPQKRIFDQTQSMYKDFVVASVEYLSTRQNELSSKTVASGTTEDDFKALDTKATQLQDNLFSLGNYIQGTLAFESEKLTATEHDMKQNILVLTVIWIFLAALIGYWVSKKRPHLMTIDEEEHARQLAHLNKELNERNKLLAEQEVALEENNGKLKNIDALKSEFVSIVAHQLRTPLAGIKWTLDMLINGDLGTLTVEQKTFLLKIHEGNERMIRFVNDLLSINRIETGRLEYNFTPINLQHVAESVLLDIYPLANKKQVSINFRGKGLKIPLVAADPEKIRVVFQNILENAVKYTGSGGHVTLELRNRGGEVLTTVNDDGIGMPKEEQKAIFTRFYRAPSAVKMQTEGSGLGLYLVKAIVEAHGGKVWFESDKGKGSTFYFSIPVPRKEA
jgi:signal transduction histidine kinase